MTKDYQPVASTQSTPAFLRGGGEMGALTRAFALSETSLGPPENWPLSLRTTLGIMLHSAFPMFLFWGKELTCFYNDAYRPSLGSNGKHSAVGKPGREVWPEIWYFIGPIIEQVMTSIEPVWYEDQLLPIYRNGRLEDVYWTFSYSPAYGDDGHIAGVFVTCTETTEKVRTINRLQLSEQRFQNLVRDASVGIIVLSGEDMRVDVVNDAYARLIDRRRDELLNKPLFNVIPETEEPFRPMLDVVRLTGEPFYHYGHPYSVHVDGARKDGFLNLIGQPYKEQDGTITGVIVLCQDVTEQKKAEGALRTSENLFRNVTNSAPTGLWLSDQTGGLTYLNSTLVEWTGLSYDVLLGTGWLNAIIEEDRQRSVDVFLTAIAARAHYDVQFRIRLSDGRSSWCQAAGDPYYDETGGYAGYAGFCMNIDELVQQRQAIEMSEARLRSVVETAPVGIGLFMGRDLVIELPNQTFIDIVGKGSDIVGRPLREVMPELLAENQAFLQILDDVFTSGRQFHTDGLMVQIVQQGVMTHNYYNITYTPLFNEAGDVYAILDIAVDVTEAVLARQKVEEAETGLRGAVELAQLGTWSIDVATNGLTYSDRLIDWFGYNPGQQAYSEVIPILQADDRERVETAVARAMNPASNGVYDEIYTVIHPKTGKKRVLHAQGKTVFDATGKAVRMSGTAQDITIQRELQLALENEVQERTRQLEESIQGLRRSNENLQQFAYVASHDLQEPLRKIQSFGDLLKNRYADQLGAGIDHLQRMQMAASRMSVLIKDLLTFSRISTQPDNTASVSLTEVVKTVLTDLDLVIDETGAQVGMEPLPTVQGNASQLEQLFQNLFSNALKFRKTGSVPVIQINVRRVAATDMPATAKPTRAAAAYQRIDVIDNGIGFDQKYTDRIFQVFQRLHGRNEFVGTGIGLAICEKVVANHGGAITATSQPGQGATFSVYLPI